MGSYSDPKEPKDPKDPTSLPTGTTNPAATATPSATLPTDTPSAATTPPSATLPAGTPATTTVPTLLPSSFRPSDEFTANSSRVTGLSYASMISAAGSRIVSFCQAPGTAQTDTICNGLGKNVCATTQCCVLLKNEQGNAKCVAGDQHGPTLTSYYQDPTIPNVSLYIHQNECYGNCINETIENTYSCSTLPSSICASTQKCVLLGDGVCTEGSRQGPHDRFQVDRYYYEGKCYGNCLK